jgi:hypothetical protein
MLSDRDTWLSASAAALVAVVAYGLPLKLNIVLAIGASVLIGLLLQGLKPALKAPEPPRESA